MATYKLISADSHIVGLRTPNKPVKDPVRDKSVD